METMKAAFYNGDGMMDVAEYPKPTPGPGDSLVRVQSTGICGSDLQKNADKTKPDEEPVGHEVAGVIVEIGDGVDPSRLGQRVAIETIGHGRACGSCWFCRSGQYKQCLNQFPVEGGGFAEYIKRRDFGCYPVPDTLSWESAALVEPLAVSIHGVRRGNLQGGETVAILGSGNIGLTSVAAARAMGAGKIFVTARHKQQVSMALSLGADVAVSSEGPALKDALADATNGRGADLTIETVGGKSDATLKQAVAVTRMQGRIVILGGFRVPLVFEWLTPLLREQSIIFSSCYGIINGYHDYEVAIELMATGRVFLDQMVTHRYPLSNIQDAFATAYDKATGSIKVQIHQ